MLVKVRDAEKLLGGKLKQEEARDKVVLRATEDLANSLASTSDATVVVSVAAWCAGVGRVGAAFKLQAGQKVVDTTLFLRRARLTDMHPG